MAAGTSMYGCCRACDRNSIGPARQPHLRTPGAAPSDRLCDPGGHRWFDRTSACYSAPCEFGDRYAGTPNPVVRVRVLSGCRLSCLQSSSCCTRRHVRCPELVGPCPARCGNGRCWPFVVDTAATATHLPTHRLSDLSNHATPSCERLSRRRCRG